MEVNYVEKNGALDITISLDCDDVTCLKHDLAGVKGIVEWFSKGPSKEKIRKCKERLFNQQMSCMRNKGIAIPADDKELIACILADQDYKDREARDVKK